MGRWEVRALTERSVGWWSSSWQSLGPSGYGCIARGSNRRGTAPTSNGSLRGHPALQMAHYAAYGIPAPLLFSRTSLQGRQAVGCCCNNTTTTTTTTSTQQQVQVLHFVACAPQRRRCAQDDTRRSVKAVQDSSRRGRIRVKDGCPDAVRRRSGALGGPRPHGAIRWMVEQFMAVARIFREWLHRAGLDQRGNCSNIERITPWAFRPPNGPLRCIRHPGTAPLLANIVAGLAGGWVLLQQTATTQQQHVQVLRCAQDDTSCAAASKPFRIRHVATERFSPRNAYCRRGPSVRLHVCSRHRTIRSDRRQ